MCNARSLRPKVEELSVHLKALKPTFLGVCETWLDASCKKLLLPGYVLVSRRDRPENPNRGGITLYARSTYNCIVHLRDSLSAERFWQTVHSSLGPVLFVLWYRQN